MADQLDEEEAELLRKHREKKARQKSGRKVTVRGKHDSGAEYSFDLDGDEAERVIARHRALWDDEDDDEDGGQAADDGGEGAEGGSDAEGGAEGGQAKPRPRRKPAAGSAPAPPAEARRAPYFRR